MWEIKGATGEAALRGLVLAVDAPPCSCFSSFVPRCAFFPSLSPLSLLHQLAVVTFFFLSAVSSAWHSVWRMMVTPEEGANVRCTLPSSHHNLYSTTRRATRHRRDIERGVLTVTPYLGKGGWDFPSMFPPLE